MQKGYNAKGSWRGGGNLLRRRRSSAGGGFMLLYATRPTPFCLCDSLCVSIGMCVCVYRDVAELRT